MPREEYLRKLTAALAYPDLEWMDLGPRTGEELLQRYADGAHAGIRLRGEHRA